MERLPTHFGFIAISICMFPVPKRVNTSTNRRETAMGKKMDKDTNAVNWFEIAVNDIKRATKFYETIFEITLRQGESTGMKMAMFPTEGSNGTVGGSLVQSQMHKPSAAGAVVYLNANPDMQLVLDRIEKAGGKVTTPKTLIDKQIGYMAFFIDTEGNRVALHSNG